MKSSNVDQLDQLLHDDLVFITPDGQTLTKSMDLEAHRSGSMVIDKFVPSIESIKLFGDTAAVALLVNASGEMLGQPISGTFRYLRVWKQFDDSLKVIGGCCAIVA
ncbi:hypothetical protein D3C71_1783930 [compost metagenome]